MLRFRLKLNVERLLTALCCDVDLSNDTALYLKNRYKREGITFLTVTLPKLSKAVLSSLEKGYFDRTDLTCFRWKGKALAMFNELISLIFDRNGALRPDACSVAIYRIKQLSEYFYKLALGYSDDSVRLAKEAFVKVDESLNAKPFYNDFTRRLKRTVSSKYSISNIKYDEVLSSCRPRSGPGTFSGYGPKGREVPFYVFKESTDFFRIPCLHKGISGYHRPYPADRTPILHVPKDTSVYSELLLVPKDSRGPRTIVREPFYKLRVQMSFFDFFSRHIQHVTKGRVNFTDQLVNKQLAKQGSTNGSYATIDLKEASDRVRFDLVKFVFGDISSVNNFLTKFRTTHCIVNKCEKPIKLNKLAGMGSGFTFVLLAWLIHHAITEKLMIDHNLSRDYASSVVYVYGDDIVIPTTYVNSAYAALDYVGLVVNKNKSYTKLFHNRPGETPYRYFRESCGGDYYGGDDVSSVKLRLANCGVIYNNRSGQIEADKQSNFIAQLSAHQTELAKNGLNHLSAYVSYELEARLGSLPLINNFDSSCIGIHTRVYVPASTNEAGNYDLIKVLVATPIRETNESEACSIRLGRKFSNGLGKTYVNSPIIDGFSSPDIPQFEVVVPRALILKRKKVSALHLQR